MLLLVIPAFFSVALLSATFQMASNSLAVGPEPERISHEVTMYRQFVYAADQYMKSSSAPSSPATVTWAQMRVAPSTPPGIASLAMPPSWKVVKGASAWVVCGEVDTKTATAMNQLLTSGDAVSRVVQAGTGGGSNPNGYVVYTKEDLTAAKALSSLCG